MTFHSFSLEIVQFPLPLHFLVQHGWMEFKHFTNDQNQSISSLKIKNNEFGNYIVCVRSRNEYQEQFSVKNILKWF